MGCGTTRVESDKGKIQSPLKDNIEPPMVIDSMANTMEIDQLISVGKKVVRGQDWKAGKDDGGPGSPGTVMAVSTEERIITVKWEKTDIVGEYMYGVNQRTTDGRRATFKPVYEIQSQVAFNAMADIIDLGAHMPLTKLREKRPSNSNKYNNANLGIEYPNLDEDNDNHHLTFLTTT